MKKRVLCALLSTLLVFLMLPAAAYADGEVLYVDPAYANADSDGTEAKPFTTLLAAVNSTAGGAVTVHLKPGEYNRELFDVGKNGTPLNLQLTIIGTMGETKTPADSSVFTGYLDFFTNTSPTCTITMKDICFIKGASSTDTVGCRIIFPAVVENCYFSGWTSSALKVYSSIVARNCVFEGNKRGIHMDGTASDVTHGATLTFVIENCTFRDATSGSASKYGGVAISDDYSGTMDYNEFVNAGLNTYSSNVNATNNAFNSGVTVNNTAVTPNLDGNYWGENGVLVAIDGDETNLVTGEELAAIVPTTLAESPIIAEPAGEVTDVIANAAPAYIIVIPELVDFGTVKRSDPVQTKAFYVRIEDALLDFGAVVNVDVDSAFTMKNAAAAEHVLPYQLFNAAADGAALATGGRYCSFGMEAAEGVTEIGEDFIEQVDGRVTTNPGLLTRAGAYSDTMVFVCEYVAA